jgi:hypothetical protein
MHWASNMADWSRVWPGTVPTHRQLTRAVRAVIAAAERPVQRRPGRNNAAAGCCGLAAATSYGGAGRCCWCLLGARQLEVGWGE